jgi:nucleolar GTP-binding protein
LTREEKIANIERDKITTLSSEIISKLDSIINQFPWIENLHPFYIEICNLLGNVDKIRRILGRLAGISQQIREMEKEQLIKLKRTSHPVEMAQIRRETGGRYVSLVKKASGDVKYLIKVVKKLKMVPDFDMMLPTIVIAGAPNVGKSSLVREISSGTPEVGEYPFTTKEIVFGHRDFGFIKVQIVDTPGLLDRPFNLRNVIERQSIASIHHIADIVVFMFDYSKDTTITPTEQINLKNDIQNEFPETEIIQILNKIDLLSEKETQEAQEFFGFSIPMSVETKVGIDELILVLEEKINEIINDSEKFKEYFKINISEEFLPSKDDDTINYEF